MQFVMLGVALFCLGFTIYIAEVRLLQPYALNDQRKHRGNYDEYFEKMISWVMIRAIIQSLGVGLMTFGIVALTKSIGFSLGF